MKHRQSLWITCLVLLVTVPLPAEEKEKVTPYEERLRKTWGQDMKKEFDAKTLRALADQAVEGRGPLGTMRPLILQAAFNKDASFKDLLERPELRANKPMDLALSAYDYAINQSDAALDHILAHLATESIGADSDAIVVMSILDEWDLTVRAYRKHFVRTDGAGGSCKASFLATRAYLYPEKYAGMREAIEAPIVWTLPLLPKKR